MVGTQARYLIEGLLKTGKYSFRCFGGAIKHANYDTIVVNDDFIIKPIDGFGDQSTLRHAIATEKPDAIFLFTDPRFFEWLLAMEDEIHNGSDKKIASGFSVAIACLSISGVPNPSIGLITKSS